MSKKKATKKTPTRPAELAGSTLVGTELDASGHAADDRVVAVIQLADGRTWRASRGLLCKMGYEAFFKSEAYEVIQTYVHALDELSGVEHAKDDVREIIQSMKDHFQLFSGLLPEEEVLQALDPRRILGEIRAKLEEADKQAEPDAEAEDAPQAFALRASDLEVDL